MTLCCPPWQKCALMEQVAHQTIVMQFILELAKSLKVDPRACFRQFFTKIKVGALSSWGEVGWSSGNLPAVVGGRQTHVHWGAGLDDENLTHQERAEPCRR